ncbi:prolyl 4-hydroxylase subunit alpha-1-like isoform X1 [Corythoichthys intestinalis]|uniref:prolyl 4-hydroxylase subunit alpha-1-like isoform X1 n=1 Tax=Corythoichthys intestinalis TaxID=161448 RepID=UPI0025A66AAB|nr:prolyl 4-hydroxylase subunit alpha-1-like isoform X1 [Corythoichthys intestinalis]
MEICCLLLILFGFSSAEDYYYTSIGQMTQLLYTEKDLLALLDKYIDAEQKKLDQMKRLAQKLANLSTFTVEDPKIVLGHPLNSFVFLKRLNRTWSELENLLFTDVSEEFVYNLRVRMKNFPDEVDQTGVAEALLRLQDTYKLDTDTLAKGDLPGTSRLLSTLTAEDCFFLSMVAYETLDFYHTVLWLSQALRQLEQGETPGTVNAVTILDYLSYSLYKQGDLERASEFTKQLLKIEPQNQRALDNLKYFDFHLEKQKTGQETPEPLKTGRATSNPVYERLCRGESLELTPRRQSRLFCRYHDNHGHPSLLIGPVKEEELWDQPRIVRYYDVANNDDTEIIKKLAKPRLMRSKVRDEKTNKILAIPSRISQNAWLGDFEYTVVDKLAKRMGDITGLDTSTAEMMQVANYGVGGQYEPHIDFVEDHVPEPYKELGTGNRIATWLLYISDVPAGGATVFPRAGAVAWPIKGSAVFWYNLQLNGKGDYLTQHAACPVLVGSKWVANTWLHERGQEFRRRCGLQSSI